jgi:Tol biopolymer transport system component
MRRLTQDHALNLRPSLTADKSKMVYVSNRTGNLRCGMRNLVSETRSRDHSHRKSGNLRVDLTGWKPGRHLGRRRYLRGRHQWRQPPIAV